MQETEWFVHEIDPSGHSHEVLVDDDEPTADTSAIFTESLALSIMCVKRVSTSEFHLSCF